MQLNAAATKTPYLEVMKQIKKNDLWQFPVKACSLNLSLQYRDAGQGMLREIRGNWRAEESKDVKG